MANKKDTLTLIPERLKNVRTSLGISKAEASRRLDLSKMGYGRYESGERDPSPQTILAIAEGLNTSVDYLVGLTEDMSSDKIVICKKNTPELFELVQACADADGQLLKRVHAYYLKLADEAQAN